jgi:hypothetical protein
MPSKLAQDHGGEKYLHAPQTVSRLPFSSQIEDGPKSDRSFDTLGASSFSASTSSPDSEHSTGERRLQSNYSSLDRRDAEQRGNWTQNNKKPNLNIVTDFTATEKAKLRHVFKGRSRAGQEGAHSSKPKPAVTKSSSKGPVLSPGFVNLTDLESLRKKKKRSLRQRKGEVENRKKAVYHRMGREKQSRQIESLLDHEAEKPSHAKETVVIGITIPKMEAGANKQSQELGSGKTLETPATPSIVVTPAYDSSGPLESRSYENGSRRPISSVYSEAARLVYGNDSNMPAVPQLPNCYGQSPALSEDGVRLSIDTWEADSPRSQRPKSTETVIDDDGADDTEARPASAGSQEEILLPSCSTGRPRSKGWWNLMLSPMLSRNGTATTKITPSPTSPVILGLPEATRRNIDFDQRTLMTTISPETPRRAGLALARNSTWSNWTQWEQARELAKDGSRLATNDDEAAIQVPAHNEPWNPAQLLTESSARGPSLAAVPHQPATCDHQNSSPYFGYENHDCGCICPRSTGACSQHVAMSTDMPATMRSVPAVPMDPGLSGAPSHRRDTRVRSDSDSTVIEDISIDFSPTVRKAQAKQILKASRARKIPPSSSDGAEEKGASRTRNVMAEKGSPPASGSATPPPYFPPPAKLKAPDHPLVPHSRGELVTSPNDVVSPEGQRAVNPRRGIAMSRIHPPAPTFVTFNSTYPSNLPPRGDVAPVSLSDIENPTHVREKVEARRRQLEKEDAVAHKTGGLWRGRGCFPQSGCQGRGGSTGRHRRRCYIVIATILVLMIVLTVVLATQLTRKADQTPIQSQWLNLTGFPPMPTGISTIAGPDVASTVTACVQPSSLWSCALPQEEQAANSPSDPDQPNFRLEIRFRNGTVSANETVPIAKSDNANESPSRRGLQLKRQNDPFTNKLFESSPAPPSPAEQSFLGNTTDKIVQPFAGEATPFFISLLTSDPTLPANFNNTDAGSRRRLRRQSRVNGGNIPAPSLLFDGSAAPANLLPDKPLPFSQPVMLYNRGLDTEHYGFYTYFDRSIFIKTTAQFKASASANTSASGDGDGSDTANWNGGASKQDADLRCTWAQTRFLVQIWTNPSFNGRRFPPSDNNNTTTTTASSGPTNSQAGTQAGTRTVSSSATDFDRPGSFPYPVTVTLDRHGGDPSKKGAYCYGMDSRQKIVVGDKVLIAELRAASGSLINAAAGVFSNAAGDSSSSSSSSFSSTAGGIDGGSGGCRCEWRNWLGDGS